ncbi:uncharacterized protein PODANS_1_22540 [Podospora anserina S mat+]|uniref:Podospora anserina S mat+ genomic DNA chromosome 1, supercontig 6 n=1 Tax=Podospora anserina (strain S / ATCC MYA-4624 / DSM 980 / FGSC 10383) TaxID=515849 RepID=B2AS70_PODAN|nr:uncharacterized protein PODANS_1_22540 [Podospora anserina S mat+]CAP67243.1 unnamed protein product [Podospora anserina S mat+]CDP24654.1 Putative protein of unknown function [Podospora anserina S mat+]
MRGFGAGGDGGMVGMVLKVAPVVCSFFAFVFLAVALSAGSSPNYIEGLSVINFNMSTFGKNLIKAPNVQEAAQGGCDKADNAVTDAGNALGNVAGGLAGAFGGKKAEEDAKKALNGASDKVGDGVGAACEKGAEIADKAVRLGQDLVDKALGSVAKAIGLKEYYSIHIGAMCEGMYAPLFSDPAAEPNVEKCTKKFVVEQTDLSKSLDASLNVGPFKFKLSDVGLIDTIQDALDLIPRALAAMGFFFLTSVVFLALAFLGSTAALASAFVPALAARETALILPTLVCLGIGWFLAGIGTLGLTAAAEKIKNAVNEDGAKFGLSAATSPGLYFLIWAAAVLSTLGFATLAYAWYKSRHVSGDRSETDSDLDEQKHVARGQYPIMQGNYPPSERGSYYGAQDGQDQMQQVDFGGQPQGQMRQQDDTYLGQPVNDGRPSKEYYQQQQ